MKTRKNHFARHPSGYARLLLSSVGVCGVCGIVGCEKKPVASPQVPVRVTELRPEQFTASTKFSGSIEPLQSTSLAFKLPGTVKDLYRPPGMDRISLARPRSITSSMERRGEARRPRPS